MLMLVFRGSWGKLLAVPSCAQDGFVVIDVSCKSLYLLCHWAFSDNPTIDCVVASKLTVQYLKLHLVQIYFFSLDQGKGF